MERLERKKKNVMALRDLMFNNCKPAGTTVKNAGGE